MFEANMDNNMNTDAVLVQLREATKIGINKTMADCVVTSKDMVPYDTGTLHNSIQIQEFAEHENNELRPSTLVAIAAALEIGTDVDLLIAGSQIGEIAPPAARDKDLLPHRLGLFEHQHAPPALARDSGAEKPGGPATQNDCVMIHGDAP